MIVGRSRTAYSFEEERSPRPICGDVVSVSNDGLLITSSGELYRRYKNGKLRRCFLNECKISNAKLLSDNILFADDRGNVFQYNETVSSFRSLISESTHRILEISVGISHALFRTSFGLVLSYGTCVQDCTSRVKKQNKNKQTLSNDRIGYSVRRIGTWS